MDRLRGINLGGWMSQLDAIQEKDPENFTNVDYHMRHFMGPDDLTRIAKWGMNHVRLPIDHDLFFDEQGNPLKSRFSFLDDAIAAALANRLNVMLDLHRCPGHTFHDPEKQIQPLFLDEKYIQLTIRVWQYLAERYSGFANIMFEVLNEPVAPTADAWNAVKDQLCRAIREAAGNVPIVVGSNMWNWPSTYGDLTPVDDDNIVYCFHFYEPLLFTHQMAPWMPEPEFQLNYNYPDNYGDGVVRQFDMTMSRGIWDKHRFERELAPVIDFRQRHQVPVICNEFGVFAGVPRAPQLHWMTDFLSVLKKAGIGFSYWNYKNLDFGIISKGESLHAQRSRYNHPHRVDMRMVELLKKY